MTPLRQALEERAGRRCEYCKVHAALQRATFHLDHVRPTSLSGPDDFNNRAFACPTCNLAKSDRQTLPDPETGEPVTLFNPREDRWAEHFRFDGYVVVGLTPIGRALVAAFDLNSTQFIFIRSIEAAAGLFPPESG